MQKNSIKKAAAKMAAGIIAAGTAVPAAALPVMADSSAKTEQTESKAETKTPDGQSLSALSVSLQTAGSSQVTLFSNVSVKAWTTKEENFYTEPSLASDSISADKFTEVRITGKSASLSRIEYNGKTY